MYIFFFLDINDPCQLQTIYSSLQQSITKTLESCEDYAHSEVAATTKQFEDYITRMEILFMDFMDVTSKIVQNQNETIDLYKDIVKTGKLLGGLLTISERSAIKEEVSKTKSLFNLGIRERGKVVDMTEILDPGIFEKLLQGLKRDCPTIMNILEQLVLSYNTSRNTKRTETVKLKASVHLLASLMDIRDQRASNDVPLLFGLLCLCFGAGPSMIELLQHLGLSESYPVL